VLALQPFDQWQRSTTSAYLKLCLKIPTAHSLKSKHKLWTRKNNLIAFKFLTSVHALSTCNIIRSSKGDQKLKRIRMVNMKGKSMLTKWSCDALGNVTIDVAE